MGTAKWQRIVFLGFLLCDLAITAVAQTFKVVYSFRGGTDGGRPYGAGVIRDGAGNLYGTTSWGGTSGTSGVIYKIDSSGNETVLYNFCSQLNCADGSGPETGLIRDSSGNLYGTTPWGGSGISGVSCCGVVYRLNHAGVYTALYRFTGLADGSFPNASLTLDPAGNLYGTIVDAYTGGVFEVDTANQESVLYNFCTSPVCADGAVPVANLVRDSSGNLYGTTRNGGWFRRNPSVNSGVVFQVDPTGHESVLHTFCAETNCADGGSPYSGLFRDTTGNLYGTAFGGGLQNCPGGCGVIYKINSAGHYKVLYSFTGGADGAAPLGGLIRDSKGNFYGTASAGGQWGAGVVFKLDPTSNETVLYNFTGTDDGANPQATLIRDTAGNLYGTTGFGGVANMGVVFKIEP